jgi:peptidyl-tRNA hydrolase
MREKIRESLKTEVSLIGPIRAKMREAHDWAKYDLNVQKNARRPVRRSLSLALAYLNGTPYAKAEQGPGSAPSAAGIANVLGVSKEEIDRWIGGALPERKAPLMKLYVITRADLPPGAQAVQSAHALREFAATYPDIEKQWYETSNTLIMLEVPTEKDLFQLHLEAGLHNIPVVAFQEPDLNHSVTALALGPSARKLEIVRKLPLALSEKAA